MNTETMTINEAARFCKIRFEHAWWMVTTGRWEAVRIPSGDNDRVTIIRVKFDQVADTRKRWADEDRERNTARIKSRRRPRKNVAA